MINFRPVPGWEAHHSLEPQEPRAMGTGRPRNWPTGNGGNRRSLRMGRRLTAPNNRVFLNRAFMALERGRCGQGNHPGDMGSGHFVSMAADFDTGLIYLYDFRRVGRDPVNISREIRFRSCLMRRWGDALNFRGIYDRPEHFVERGRNILELEEDDDEALAVRPPIQPDHPAHPPIAWQYQDVFPPGQSDEFLRSNEFCRGEEVMLVGWLLQQRGRPPSRADLEGLNLGRDSVECFQAWVCLSLLRDRIWLPTTGLEAMTQAFRPYCEREGVDWGSVDNCFHRNPFPPAQAAAPPPAALAPPPAPVATAPRTVPMTVATAPPPPATAHQAPAQSSPPPVTEIVFTPGGSFESLEITVDQPGALGITIAPETPPQSLVAFSVGRGQGRERAWTLTSTPPASMVRVQRLLPQSIGGEADIRVGDWLMLLNNASAYIMDYAVVRERITGGVRPITFLVIRDREPPADQAPDQAPQSPPPPSPPSTPPTTPLPAQSPTSPRTPPTPPPVRREPPPPPQRQQPPPRRQQPHRAGKKRA